MAVPAGDINLASRVEGAGVVTGVKVAGWDAATVTLEMAQSVLVPPPGTFATAGFLTSRATVTTDAIATNPSNSRYIDHWLVLVLRAPPTPLVTVPTGELPAEGTIPSVLPGFSADEEVEVTSGATVTVAVALTLPELLEAVSVYVVV